MTYSVILEPTPMIKMFLRGREPWSSGYGYDWEVVSSNPGAAYWMDLTFSHLFAVKIVLFDWKDRK